MGTCSSPLGLACPVAIFDTVELEGTEVSRASVHNVSVAQSLRLGIGSKVEVYKANMIIPQIAKTVESTGETVIPGECPLCGGETVIKDNDGIKTLLAVYFEQNTTNEKFEDIDGERWIINE